MATLPSYFDTFLRDIRPTEKQRNDCKTGHETLRKRLLADEDLASWSSPLGSLRSLTNPSVPEQLHDVFFFLSFPAPNSPTGKGSPFPSVARPSPLNGERRTAPTGKGFALSLRRSYIALRI